MTTSQQLDARGLKCPLPVLKARKAMKALSSGDTLEVLASDPSAPQDFRSFCDTTGHLLRESDERDGVYRFLLEKAGQ